MFKKIISFLFAILLVSSFFTIPVSATRNKIPDLYPDTCFPKYSDATSVKYKEDLGLMFRGKLREMTFSSNRKTEVYVGVIFSDQTRVDYTNKDGSIMQIHFSAGVHELKLGTDVRKLSFFLDKDKEAYLSTEGNHVCR